MSNTTIKTRKAITKSALFKNVAIYSILSVIGLIAAIIDKHFDFAVHFKPHGYVIIAAAVLGYILLGYLIWCVYLPTLESPPGRKKGTYYKKVYALKDSLKKNYLLLTIFLIGIVLITFILSIVESVGVVWLNFGSRFILYALCSSYILNWLDAIIVYPYVQDIKKWGTCKW